MKKLTIVMPFLNEGEEPLNTIKSIYATCEKEAVQIIAIDDCSTSTCTDFSEFPEVTVIRNAQRRGSGAAKHQGVLLAQTKHVLIIDGHMRFRNDGWLERITEALRREPTTLFCTTSVRLSKEDMQITEDKRRYFGANLVLVDQDNQHSTSAQQIIEPKWADEKPERDYEIQCILGANYAVNRDWFLKLRGFDGLQKWGTEEAFLSIKSWMAGGKCKILKDIEIGHMYREEAPYITPSSHLFFNKIWMCECLFSTKLSKYLRARFPATVERRVAYLDLNNRAQLLNEARSYYASIRVRSPDQICQEWGILPMH